MVDMGYAAPEINEFEPGRLEEELFSIGPHADDYHPDRKTPDRKYRSNVIYLPRNVGYLPGKEEKTSNPFKRWKKKVGRVWEVYTDIGKPLELWKPILAGAVAKGLKSIETVPEERHGIEDITGGAVTMLRTGLEQYAHNKPYQIVPALRRHLSAAEGASNLKYLYVYDRAGDPREYAIYLSGGEEPEHDFLRNQIEYVDSHGRSPYEDDTLDLKRKIITLFDREDGPPVLNAATLFNYADYFADEPQRAERWAVKDDSWLANQYGERNTPMEAALPADLQGKVRIYERPVKTSGFWYGLGKILGDESPRSGRMWQEWAVKKPIIYAVGDLLFEPLEVIMEKILPSEAMRNMLYQKAKGISGVWRGMTNPRATYLWYGV